MTTGKDNKLSKEDLSTCKLSMLSRIPVELTKYVTTRVDLPLTIGLNNINLLFPA